MRAHGVRGSGPARRPAQLQPPRSPGNGCGEWNRVLSPKISSVIPVVCVGGGRAPRLLLPVPRHALPRPSAPTEMARALTGGSSAKSQCARPLRQRLLLQLDQHDHTQRAAAGSRAPACAPACAPAGIPAGTPGWLGQSQCRDGRSCCGSLTGSRHLPWGSPGPGEQLGSGSDPPQRPCPGHPPGCRPCRQRVPVPHRAEGCPSVPGLCGRLGGLWGRAPLQGSASVPESWKRDCLRRLSRAHLGQVVELS